MRILVTGRHGQLARSLAEIAGARADCSLLALGRPELDLEDGAAIGPAIERFAPDLVVNAAAYTAVDAAESEPDRCFRINAEAAGELAGAAWKSGAHFVQVSTDYVFDGRSDAAYGEDSPTHPLGIYGRSKLAGEELVLSEHPEAIVVRTAWLYSPFGKNFLRTMMAMAARREAPSVVADQWGNPSSALDIAEGLLTLAGALREGGLEGPGRIYHLAGSGSASWFDFAEHIMSESDRLGLPSAPVMPIPTADRPTPAARPRNGILDCGRFEAEFGFRAPHWRQSSSKMIERLAGERHLGLDPESMDTDG